MKEANETKPQPLAAGQEAKEMRQPHVQPGDSSDPNQGLPCALILGWILNSHSSVGFFPAASEVLIWKCIVCNGNFLLDPPKVF